MPPIINCSRPVHIIHVITAFLHRCSCFCNSSPGTIDGCKAPTLLESVRPVTWGYWSRIRDCPKSRKGGGHGGRTDGVNQLEQAPTDPGGPASVPSSRKPRQPDRAGMPHGFD
eukprot:gene17540-biopygen6396